MRTHVVEEGKEGSGVLTPPFLSRPACDARMPFGVRVQQN